jgi:hypothetical protein
LVDFVLEALFCDKLFIELCAFLRSHAIRLDEQNKDDASEQIRIIGLSSSITNEDKGKHHYH